MRFAVPNKGRISEPALTLIKRAGFAFRTKERMLYASCTTADVLFVFVRAEDIPLMVARGAVDVGITGSDLVLEKQADVTELLRLDFGQCRLCVAVGASVTGDDIEQLRGATVTTSFPTITADYFRRQGIEVNCVEMSGSIEVTVGLGIADAVVDIVETGDSLRENNLRVFREIGRYQTVLIAGRDRADDERVARIRRRMEGILIANKYGMLEYNIPASQLKEAEKITPGYESPTVSELDEKGWCAVKVMVEKEKIADAMDRLEAIGATALIETEIRNCRLGGKR